MKEILVFLFPKTCQQILNEGFKMGLISNKAHKLPTKEFKKMLDYVKNHTI